ncbi:MAG: LysE family transporter [Cyanobacteria bacterium P01_F01_bin.86]
MMLIFLTGLGLGLALAAPVGPIGILCIRRTLDMGPLVGLVSGLGAATADGFYGCIAGFGLTVVADFLTGQAIWLRIIGGLFLCYLGVTTFLAKPAPNSASALPVAPVTETSSDANAPVLPRSLLAAYSSTLVLTLTNPATIFTFVGLFSGLGVVESGPDYATSGVLVAGVFFGSALWWVVLSGTVNLLRSRVTPTRMRWLNRVSGTVIFVFGVVALTIRT